MKSNESIKKEAEYKIDNIDNQIISSSVSFSATHKTEDTATFTFVGVPNYNGKKIHIQMPMEIGFDNKKLKLVVRNIQTNISNNTVQTQLTLGTRTILLDSVLDGGYEHEADISVAELIQKLCGLRGCSLSGVEGDTNIMFPVSPVRIAGNQNLIDYLDEHLNINKQPHTLWWIDAFGVLNIRKPNYDGAKTTKLDWSSWRDYVVNATLNIIEKWEEKKVSTSVDTSDPTKQITKTPATKWKSDGKKVSYESAVIYSTIGANNQTSTPADATKRIAVKSKELKLTLNGIHYLPVYGKIEITNHPTLNSTYDVESIDYATTLNTTSTSISAKTTEPILRDK